MDLATEPLWDRKEIATRLNVSVDSVRRNEIRWGLVKARSHLNKRLVRYRARMVLRELRARGFFE